MTATTTPETPAGAPTEDATHRMGRRSLIAVSLVCGALLGITGFAFADARYVKYDDRHLGEVVRDGLPRTPTDDQCADMASAIYRSWGSGTWGDSSAFYNACIANP